MRPLVVLAFSAACASAPARPPAPSFDVLAAQADGALLRGCYSCLLSARDEYERLAAGAHRAAAAPRLFETHLLLALREKELAMDPGGSLGRARALVPELGVPSAERFLSAVEAVWSDAAGWPRNVLEPFKRQQAGFIGRIDEEVDWLLAAPDLRPPVRQYIALSLDCLDRSPYGRRAPERERVADLLEDQPPLLAYRMATCERLHAPVLTALLEEDGGFPEAGYFLGWASMLTIDTDGGADVRKYARIARAAFPHSPSVAYLAATSAQLSSDHTAALSLFDETLAMQDRHEGAALGRTVSLTQLERHEEAVASATRMIDAGLDNADMALYWRAWNQRILQRLDLARQDIDAAKARRSTPEIHTLAGVIQHDQNELDAAKRDLRVALQMSGARSNCTAMEYLGLVHMREPDAAAAALALDDAATCQHRRAESDAAKIAATERLTADQIDEGTRAAIVARLRTSMAQAEASRRWAAINGANAAHAAGDVERARRLVEIAAPDPRFADQVAAIRALLAREN